MIQSFQSLNVDKRILLLLSFMLNIITYITLPFLAIFLMFTKNISIIQTGFIVGMIPLIAGLSSSMLHIRLKKCKWSIIAIWAMILYAIGYTMIIVAKYKVLILLAPFFIGIGDALINPIIKALLSYNENKENISKIFYLRYLGICLAVIIGPIIGNLVNLYNSKAPFIVAIVLYLFMIIFIIKINSYDIGVIAEKSPGDLKEKTRINYDIVILLVFGVILFTIFSVFESGTPIALNSYGEQASQIYSILIAVNSIVVLLLSSVIVKIESRIGLKNVFYLGIFSYSMAYIIFSFYNINIFYLLIATIIFSFAEICTIPNIDILTSYITKEEDRRINYSALELKIIGFFIGPFFVSILVDNIGTKGMYIIFALVSFVFLLFSTKLLTILLNSKYDSH